MLLSDIELAADIRRQVESVVCRDCNGARLTFYSVKFDAGFKLEQGGRVLIDSHCRACKRESQVIMNIEADEHLD